MRLKDNQLKQLGWVSLEKEVMGRPYCSLQLPGKEIVAGWGISLFSQLTSDRQNHQPQPEPEEV